MCLMQQVAVVEEVDLQSLDDGREDATDEEKEAELGHGAQLLKDSTADHDQHDAEGEVLWVR